MTGGRTRVDDAFAAVRRADFLPPKQRAFAGEDRALLIGYGQTNSQPSTVRAMLELLDVHPGDRVLDVGSGSGWTTALLAALVGTEGSVLGVERVPELVAAGRAALAGYDLPWAEIRQASPDELGVPAEAPFDRILVSAEATRLPGALVEQLAVGGVMVVPVAGVMTEVRRTDTGPAVVPHGAYTFVPLVEPSG
ncbi:MAG TPA: methyltransferase domain-containing protein [Nocardioidaceae bacterium]|nr:methyltransferase domain-containing protein [Nocardioidaceae bacterium]